MKELQLQGILSFWEDLNVSNIKELSFALNGFDVLFAYHSGKIENDQITYQDVRSIFEDGKVSNFTGDLRTLFEIQNQKDCYEEILKKVVEREQLTLELVKRINYLLCKNTIDERRYRINGERAGEFKKHDYVVGRNEVGSAPCNVEFDLKDLIAEINEENEIPILMKAAYFHCRFEHIHPFSDGNGRTGRTLLNYFLMVSGYPPLIVYEEDRKAYYLALEKYDECDEIDDMIQFLEFSLIKTWKKQVIRKMHQDS